MMDDPDSERSPTARRLIEELRPHTPFAEAIVRRQAERAGLLIHSLSASDLPKVVPLILAAATGFVDPAVIIHIRRVFLGR
jgi:hypothetical protein